MTARYSKRGNDISRVPFPDLPLPQKRTIIRANPTVKITQTTPITIPKAIPKTPKSPIAAISIPDPITDAPLEPEPPKTQHNGDHTIENLDSSDYQ